MTLRDKMHDALANGDRETADKLARQLIAGFRSDTPTAPRSTHKPQTMLRNDLDMIFDAAPSGEAETLAELWRLRADVRRLRGILGILVAFLFSALVYGAILLLITS